MSKNLPIELPLELPQIGNELRLDTTNPQEAVNHINSYIKSRYCKYMSIDISSMNVLDACYVSTLCSTNHFIKYPDGKIDWKISSELVRDFNEGLELGNTAYSI